MKSHESPSDWRAHPAFSEKLSDFYIRPGGMRRQARGVAKALLVLVVGTGILLSIGRLSGSVTLDVARRSLGMLPSSNPNNPGPATRATSNEAYVLFLPSVTREEYLLSLRTLLYGFLYDEDTRDVRDVVVMTTPQVPLEIEDQLRAESAIISQHDLITSIPSPHDLDGNHRWKDQYNKLLLFNMTQYERVLYVDSDMLMMKSLKDIWDEEFTWPASGLTAPYQAHTPHDDYLNGGFLLTMPNQTMFEEIMLVRDFPMLWDGDMEQALLNKYFHRGGAHPWAGLEKDNKWVATGMTKDNLERGVHIIHEKCWMDVVDRELTSAWRTKVGKMLGYWEARREMLGETRR